MKKNLLILLLLSSLPFRFSIHAEDGYELWMRYHTISNQPTLKEYKKAITNWTIKGESAIIDAAKKELQTGLNGLLGNFIPETNQLSINGIVIAGTINNLSDIADAALKEKLKHLGSEGYVIVSGKVNKKKAIIIAANSDIGVLYGVFHFLRVLQTQLDITGLAIESAPKTKIRVLNHWDNLDRTVERGYAGFSLWDWHKLPDYLYTRYTDYARANASIGINGTVLTNVNANALVLTKDYLEKVAALAGVFRPYGIKVYLTARFSAPIEIGKLKTADPLDPDVVWWWNEKVKEIYSYIPDFGGFLVKANSEGQPGPQNYERSHADGANMLADALKPFNGIVMWRAFVYDNNVPEDRAKQAYNEFVPLDGTFRDNVLIQVKNGAIDFQPREPFHPLFGAMPKTPEMMEFQITQEYLGFATHLVYLATLFEECLKSDTYAKGKGSTVASIIDGSLEHKSLSGMAGVSNIGTDRNWTGHPFGQANWYAFGRLAWDPYLTSGDIANEWIRMTFSNSENFINTVKSIMLASREITVNYMTPIGLHHIMGRGHHFGPGPWVSEGRPDWTSLYYHRADSLGIGFDRTSTGSDAVSQYFPPVRDQFENVETCPENVLLWFHHLPWDYKMKSGRTLWDEMCYKYYAGVDSVIWMQKEWEKTKGLIDNERYNQVKTLLKMQEKEAIRWRDACVLYFQTFSKRPIPNDLEKPEQNLDYYINEKFYYVP
ncbi:MAG: alpha-glucuronidase [Bacteroidales bacterium]|nr:alpha-glucuronidase [Bacteroidales bacterium]